MGAPIPWRDEVKRSSKLTIALDPCDRQHGWAKPCQDGIAAFNALAAQMRLGVTDELTNNQANVNVIAQAKMSPGRSDGYLVWSHGTTAKNRNTANRTR
jgi:hypothetical protein